jgi:hypothetical protein
MGCTSQKSAAALNTTPPRAWMYKRTPKEAAQKESTAAKKQAEDDDSLATTVFEEESVSTEIYSEYMKKQAPANLHVVTPAEYHDAALEEKKIFVLRRTE